MDLAKKIGSCKIVYIFILVFTHDLVEFEKFNKTVDCILFHDRFLALYIFQIFHFGVNNVISISACMFLWKYCENIMKTRMNRISFLSSVIALIDAKRRQSGSNRQSRNSRLGRSGTSKTEDTSDSQVRTAILLGTVFGASSWKSRSNYKNKGERRFEF